MIGDTIKVLLPGERPWAKIIGETDEMVQARIINKLFREFSEHEQAQFTKREFGEIEPLPELHSFKQGDEIWFELGEHGDWVPAPEEQE